MKRLIILAIAATALVGTTKMWWHTPSTLRAAETVGMPSLKELHAMAGANKLPDGNIEDRSLVFRANATR